MVITTGAIRRANLQSNVTINKPTPSDRHTSVIILEQYIDTGELLLK